MLPVPAPPRAEDSLFPSLTSHLLQQVTLYPETAIALTLNQLFTWAGNMSEHWWHLQHLHYNHCWHHSQDNDPSQHPLHMKCLQETKPGIGLHGHL